MGTSRLRTFSVLFACALAGFAPLFARAGRQRVQGVMGEPFAFPAPVFARGLLLHEDLGLVAVLTGGTPYTNMMDGFRDRLSWDAQTGRFTITELKPRDEGLYRVDNNDGQRILTMFQLTVYKRASKPTVDAHNCSLLCSVENDRDVTLSWTRGEDVLKRTSSPHLNATLSLRLDVLGHPETYYCEVRNPVSSERLPVDSEEGCAPKKTTKASVRYIPVMPSAALLVFPGIFVVFLIKQKLMHDERKARESTSGRDGAK